ncbi:type I-MYXAN CRISPR-associated protein Cas6/Cmx6 [Sedimenticola sp.]|uniref:type I-MYXAN CRISPR-associated protein Cas6/Cmx6 n=1 Tax=Sedimenticola sp. TaxID=1940285 RepID=UPI003D11B38A
MFWQDEDENDITRFVVPENVLDLHFAIRCKSLPVDHAWALSMAIQKALPWFADEERAGLHLIYVAGSGNGWERPHGSGDTLYPSRRTKLILRLPAERIDDGLALSGHTLDVAGNKIEVGEGKAHPLAATNTLYARYVAITEAGQTEEAFIAQQVAELKQAGLRCKKVLCGKETSFVLPDGELLTRSLLIADLPLSDAVRLQEIGLGPHRLKMLGCGLFIPHKAV